VPLDEAGAAQMLSAVQMAAGQPGTGHASRLGMVWHAREEFESLSVTAQAEEGGTSVTVRLDRRDTLAPMVALGVLGCIGSATAAYALATQVAPELGVAAAVSGMGGLLAIGRAYWASSTRRVRQRISAIMDAVGQVPAAVTPGTGRDEEDQTG
jgi:hypothetical protein